MPVGLKAFSGGGLVGLSGLTDSNTFAGSFSSCDTDGLSGGSLGSADFSGSGPGAKVSIASSLSVSITVSVSGICTSNCGDPCARGNAFTLSLSGLSLGSA